MATENEINGIEQSSKMSEGNKLAQLDMASITNSRRLKYQWTLFPTINVQWWLSGIYESQRGGYCRKLASSGKCDIYYQEVLHARCSERFPEVL